MLGYFKNVVSDARSRGIRQALTSAARYGEERFHDWRLGINTLHAGETPAQAAQDQSYHAYHFTKYRSFRFCLKRLNIQPEREGFIDYGSGKARAVIFAARFPFRHVVGVEVCPELHAIGQENVRKALPRLACRNVELVVADAVEYQLPPDITIVYCYNPFSGSILCGMMEQVRRSLEAHPRRLRLVWRNPDAFEQEVARWPWLAKTDEFVHGLRYVVYEATA
jgi:hypothetical protein